MNVPPLLLMKLVRGLPAGFVEVKNAEGIASDSENEVAICYRFGISTTIAFGFASCSCFMRATGF